MSIDHAQHTADMDVQTLRAMVADQLQVIADQQQIIARHERTIIEREARISVLTTEIARPRRAQFAARSEKMDPAQRQLFDEAVGADIAAVEAELEALQSPPADAPAEGSSTPHAQAPCAAWRPEARRDPS